MIFIAIWVEGGFLYINGKRICRMKWTGRYYEAIVWNQMSTNFILH